MKYRIAYKSNATGASDHGSSVFNSPEEVQKFITEINKEYPEDEHWIEDEDGNRICLTERG